MNWSIFFLIAFVLSSLLSFGITIWVKKKSSKFFRSGGVAIISSFVIAILIIPEFVISSELTAILIGSVIILIFGLWDDHQNLSWKSQLLFQVFLALMLVWFGFEIDLISFSGKELLRFDYWNLLMLGKVFSVISSLFVIFWLIGIINAVNWLDGSDGLLSVAGILSLLAVFFVSLRPEVNQPALAIISMVGIGSFSGFFIFNFPSAKIEAGTGGSYFTGFLLASLAIIAGTKIATTMVVLILPVMDFSWVIIERIKDKQSMFKRDNKKRHLHYKLLSLGFSPKKILLGYGIFLGISLLISFFIVSQTQKILLLGTEFLMIFIFMISLAKGITLKKLLISVKQLLLNPIWLVVLIASSLILFSFYQEKKKGDVFYPNAQISIAEETVLKVKIIQTPAEAYKGLGGVSFLPARSGMLFIYNQISFCPHVMRDMKFGLDFVFLKNNEIVFIQEKIPSNFEGIIQSPFDCNQVLEINFGEVDQLEIEVGDIIEIGEENF